jgi:ketosteroid isomerase-like protein
MHLLDPQIEWDMTHFADFPEQVYRGHDGFRQFWRDYLSAWEEVEFILDEIIDAGDQVVVFLRLQAKGPRRLWRCRSRKMRSSHSSR